MAKAANLGFPRLGIRRELKKACEAYWSKKIDQGELEKVADELTQRHWKLQQQAGIEIIPCNDFSFYDHMLDTAVMVGAVPPRFDADAHEKIDLDIYFALARGRQDKSKDVTPLEMTKWFDTNYHYLVPEFYPNLRFHLASKHPFAAVEKARAAGIANPRPVLVGPATFLLLGKFSGRDFSRVDLVDGLVEVYKKVFRRFHELGVDWVQVDEPILVTDLDQAARSILSTAYGQLSQETDRPKIMLATYFGGLEENTELTLSLGMEGLHLDLVRAPEQLEEVLAQIDNCLTLSLGVVDGRNVWRADLDRALALLHKAASKIGGERLQVAPSCSLLHCPLDLREETDLDPEVKGWLAFGAQKLEEVAILTRALNEGEAATAKPFSLSRSIHRQRRSSVKVNSAEIRLKQAHVAQRQHQREVPARLRRIIQQDKYNLPPLPTTTIGSFPQTEAIRRLRAQNKKGLISAQQMEGVLRAEIIRAIRFQEEAGLDVLVHGEFERNDMVEYFAQQMEGFAFTNQGWVQSYGSRAVKPPLIFGDIRRRQPMTVKWSTFAQSQTRKPVKGMLTGPITMLEWSFVRDDQQRQATCEQLALAIRDEATDLEKAGIGIIQIDEPALREGMPLRRKHWESYLDWAVKCFRLASSGVRPETQIHTHMCYSEFNEMLETIASLDADVISIEASRSRMDLLEAFKTYDYPTDVGPGVFDIHSMRVPPAEEMAELLRKALRYIGEEKLWVNPDCGLKTRRWEEVIPALQNMVQAAKIIRQELEIKAQVA